MTRPAQDFFPGSHEGRAPRFYWSLLRFVYVLFLLLPAVLPRAAQSQTVLWHEDFENLSQANADWHADFGTWEMGKPTNGACYAGQNCAGTSLSGNYPENKDTRLIRHKQFVVPAQEPRLRFWHWFNFGGGDSGWVEIRPVGTNDWKRLAPDTTYNNYSSAWTRPSLDLSTYAGQTVEIAFYFQSRDCCFGDDTGPGWYIDDVTIDADAAPPPAGGTFVRGDVDTNGCLELTDAVLILGFLFLGKPTSLTCADSADLDDKGSINIADAIFLLNYLYLGGPPPQPPFPGCGEDPTGDTLTCAMYSPCS